MSLPYILALTIFSLLGGLLIPPKYRSLCLLIGSLAAIYGMQPTSAIRRLDFWLPTAAVALTVITWALTQTSAPGERRTFWTGSAAILVTIVCLALPGYSFSPLHSLAPRQIPALWQILLVVGFLLGLAGLLTRLPGKRTASALFSGLILALFILLKSDALLTWGSATLRGLAGQDTTLASALDIRWLGFSYLAFRLLHVLRDHQMGLQSRLPGKLPRCSLVEFAVYALFFPAYACGPIDRLPRFLSDFQPPRLPGQSPIDKSLFPTAEVPNQESRPPQTRRLSINLSAETVFTGSKRIVWGIFKKFVLADTLGLIALNGQNVSQASQPFWLWVILYAYALRIYFDFSGYTDIAIGMGNWWGIRLPENFTAPYLKTNLTRFWSSWHITLAQWLRAYVFNPLTRTLRTSRVKLSTGLVVFIGQMTTMLLIGLWHGITWNFAAWGAWHGLGLFIHNRYSDWWRGKDFAWSHRPGVQNILSAVSWLLTFQYVCLGWVWFALPDIGQAWGVMHRLFGV